MKVSLALTAVTLVCACGGHDPGSTSDTNPGDANPGDTDPGDTGAQRFVAPVGTYTFREVQDAAARRAVCNDGTPANYYINAGSGADADKWLVFLQGGGECGTLDDCTDRISNSPHLITEDAADSRVDAQGILSNDRGTNPDFATWTHVFVHYCSSDWWSGDADASADRVNFQFRGSQIVQAVIEDLQQLTTPGLDTATTVVFAGGSAGGVGVFVNLDRVAQMVAPVPVHGINDAGWAVGGNGYDPAVPVVSVLGQYLVFWNGQPNADCVASNGDQPAACYLGATVYPHLATAVFVHETQFDRVQLKIDGVLPPLDASEQAYVEQHGAEVRAELADVSAVFSPATDAHVGTDAPGWTGTIDGTSLRDAIGNWFFGRGGPFHLIATPGD